MATRRYKVTGVMDGDTNVYSTATYNSHKLTCTTPVTVDSFGGKKYTNDDWLKLGQKTITVSKHKFKDMTWYNQIPAAYWFDNGVTSANGVKYYPYMYMIWGMKEISNMVWVPELKTFKTGTYYVYCNIPIIAMARTETGIVTFPIGCMQTSDNSTDKTWNYTFSGLNLPGDPDDDRLWCVSKWVCTNSGTGSALTHYTNGFTKNNVSSDKLKVLLSGIPASPAVSNILHTTTYTTTRATGSSYNDYRWTKSTKASTQTVPTSIASQSPQNSWWGGTANMTSADKLIAKAKKQYYTNYAVDEFNSGNANSRAWYMVGFFNTVKISGPTTISPEMDNCPVWDDVSYANFS